MRKVDLRSFFHERNQPNILNYFFQSKYYIITEVQAQAFLYMYLVENKIKKFFFGLTDYYFFLRFCIYCKKHALNITIKVTALILQVLLVPSLHESALCK